MSKKRVWVIRGFDRNDVTNRDGVMSDIPSFTELVCDNALATIECLKSNVAYESMRAASARDTSTMAMCIDDGADTEFYSVRVNVNFDVNDYSQIRPFRTDLTNAIKQWAEQSHIKYANSQGWRLNALKQPIFEANTNGTYKMSFDVILGNVIWFSGRRATINRSMSEHAFVKADVDNLVKQLDAIVPVIDERFFIDVI